MIRETQLGSLYFVKPNNVCCGYKNDLLLENKALVLGRFIEGLVLAFKLGFFATITLLY